MNIEIKVGQVWKTTSCFATNKIGQLVTIHEIIDNTIIICWFYKDKLNKKELTKDQLLNELKFVKQ